MADNTVGPSDVEIVDIGDDAAASQKSPVGDVDATATPKPPLPPKRTRRAKVTQVTEPKSEPKTKRTSGRKRSIAWDHFKRIEEDGAQKAVCNYCGKKYYSDPKLNGTTNMIAHLSNCPKYDRKLEGGQQTLSFQSKKDGEEGVQLVATSFSVEAARKALAQMIVVDELPFRFVENPGFRNYSTVLQPKFKIIPSRYTVARDIVKIYKAEMVKLKDGLKNRRVCLTTDTWTSNQNLNYMCLTCHFIDDNWKLQKRILNFCQVDDHRGETIGKKIETCLLEWNIDSIFTLTVDNASSNSSTIRFLQGVTKYWKGTVLGHEFLHMRCCAHILNLIVCDGLKELDTSIVKVRDAVRYVKSSPHRFVFFKNCVEKLQLGDGGKGLVCLDVPTRWNSTYLMLERAQQFEKAFDRMAFEDPKYKDYFVMQDVSENGDPPNVEDWEKCRTFVKFLKLFYLATKRFSGTLYVTSNTFFDEIFVIKSKIDQLSKSPDDLCSTMAKNMKAKFDKYWGNGDKINLLLYVSVLLDPRKKLSYLQWCFHEMYGVENEKVVSNIIGKVRGAVTRLYESYASSSHLTNVQVASGNEEPSMEIDEDCDDPHTIIASRYKMYLDGQQSKECKNEVEKYLAEPREGASDKNFDILGWWKVNIHRYQVLGEVARDVLAVPVSTVASESAFSTGGRILDPFRSSLSPNMVQTLVCGQNWLQATQPISISRLLEAVEEFDNCYDAEFENAEPSGK